MSIAAINYVTALLNGGSAAQLLKHGKVGHLFRSEQDQALWTFVDNHARKYGQLQTGRPSSAMPRSRFLRPCRSRRNTT